MVEQLLTFFLNALHNVDTNVPCWNRESLKVALQWADRLDEALDLLSPLQRFRYDYACSITGTHRCRVVLLRRLITSFACTSELLVAAAEFACVDDMVDALDEVVAAEAKAEETLQKLDAREAVLREQFAAANIFADMVSSIQDLPHASSQQRIEQLLHESTSFAGFPRLTVLALSLCCSPLSSNVFARIETVLLSCAPSLWMQLSSSIIIFTAQSSLRVAHAYLDILCIDLNTIVRSNIFGTAKKTETPWNLAEIEARLHELHDVVPGRIHSAFNQLSNQLKPSADTFFQELYARISAVSRTKVSSLRG